MGIREEHPHTLKSQYGPTPLSWAAGNGYDAVVYLLLAKDGIAPDLMDSQYSQTPLSCAAERGHEVVVKLLLDTGKAEVDSKDDGGRTPLLRAAENGHEAVPYYLRTVPWSYGRFLPFLIRQEMVLWEGMVL
jgi:ankyrin repeat protein